MGLNNLDRVALILAAIGALNWGLATLDWNLVSLLLGSWPVVENIVYWVVAVAGAWTIYGAFK